MYLYHEDDTSFSLGPADELTELKAALIAAGIAQPAGEPLQPFVLPERHCQIIDFAAVRAARECR